jgi:cellulose synthase operon protein C
MSKRRYSRVVVAVALAAAIAGCGRDGPDKFVASAETYLAKSDYQAAIIELKNALAKDPDNAKARFLLGKASLDIGDSAAAVTEFRKALALKYPADDAYPLLARALVQQGAPKNEMLELANAPVQSAHAKAEIATMIGLAHMGYGQPADARAQIEAALALEPTNRRALLAQARLVAADRDFAGALQRIDAVLATAPDDVDVLMLKSELEIATGRRSDAVRTLERILTLRPSVLQARYTLALILVQSNELDRAATQVEELKKQAAGDARTLHAIAFLALARGDATLALESVQKSLQAAPDFLPARHLSGLIDLKRGAYASAEESLRTVVSKSPNDDGARIALAQVLLRRGQPAQAQEALDVTLRRMPDSTAALRLAAEIQLALKQPGKAAEYLARANALDQNNVGGRVRLAEVRLAKGETDQGVRDLEALSAAEPNAREPDMALIATHMRARNYEKALAAADALVKKQPQNSVAHNAKGAVYAAMGDGKNARQSFEKALALDPGSTEAIFNLATLDAMEGKTADAKKRYEQVLAKDPKSERALLGLAQLQIASNAPAADVVAAIERAIAANPASSQSRLALIGYLARQKDWKAALAAAQAAQAAIADPPAALLEATAGVQLAAGEKNQALETYGRLAKLQPDNPLPLMRAAGIHAALKNYDAAIAALKSSRAAAPDNSTIWVLLAALYFEANKVEEGFAEARRLQKDPPTRTAGYALEAELFAMQKKFPEAVAAYRAALAREQLPFTVTRLHGLLTAMGKPDEAASLTQKWLKDHPKDVAVRTYLGQQSIAKGDYKTAVTYYRAAAEIAPENPAVLNDLAWSLSEIKDAKAVEYAERAYRIAPNSAAIANTYGWVLVQRGDTAKGIPLLRRAVDLEPADANRRLYLARGLIASGDKPAARKELEIVVKADSASARTQAEQLLKDL